MRGFPGPHPNAIPEDQRCRWRIGSGVAGEYLSEMASEVRAGLDNLADAIRTLAGTIASSAAGMNTKTPGDQRNMAGVIYVDADQRYADVTRKLDDKTRLELTNFIENMCKGKR
jgi:hypothetical protein